MEHWKFYITAFDYNYSSNNPKYLKYLNLALNNSINTESENIILLYIYLYFNLNESNFKYINNENIIVCPITLNNVNKYFMLECKHQFSIEILNWIVKNRTCPLCRFKIQYY